MNPKKEAARDNEIQIARDHDELFILTNYRDATLNEIITSARGWIREMYIRRLPEVNRGGVIKVSVTR